MHRLRISRSSTNYCSLRFGLRGRFCQVVLKCTMCFWRPLTWDCEQACCHSMVRKNTTGVFVVLEIALQNPNPGHRTGGANRGKALRGAAAGQGWVVQNKGGLGPQVKARPFFFQVRRTGKSIGCFFEDMDVSKHM